MSRATLNKCLSEQVSGALACGPAGGGQGGYYHDDLWNIKYLPDFKWRHLTEDLAQHRADRAQKLQVRPPSPAPKR